MYKSSSSDTSTRDYSSNSETKPDIANRQWQEFAGGGGADYRRPTPIKKYYTPSKEQLGLLLPVPIKCFCNKPAHKSFTLEYGPIYECASFDYDDQDTSKFQSKYICGFHVHERSWIHLLDDIKSGKDINLEFTELRTCPQYNFTFCSIFKVTNSYKVSHPYKLPDCFCRRPVVMRTSRQGFIQFACQNGLIDGAKKCSWVLPSNEVAFPKPKTRLHSLLDEDEYLQQKQKKREELANGTMSNHKHHLLATLAASASHPDNYPEEKSIIVPTSVMVKKQQQKAKQISPSTSSVSSSVSTPTLQPTAVPDHDEVRRLQQMIEELKERHALTVANMRDQLNDTKEKMLQLQTDLYRMKNEKLEESVFSANCQERLSNIELDVVRLMNENQKLQDENLCVRTENLDLKSLKEDEPNKCIVCFTESIECCLKPCYHYAYCQPCAIKLTSCAICRRLVKSVQKIYQC